MIYALLKWYARFAIKLYCRKIIINNAAILNSKGPLLLACNHPNSFLDGVILTTLFKEPVYSLARGDAFKNKTIAYILYKLKLLPIFRTSEGVENLNQNYHTFDACQKAFERNRIVLIFSEGWCENEWHLRPLKKGTPRLVMNAWKNKIPLTVIPVGLNYSSFKKFGKEVHLFFGNPIKKFSIPEENQGKLLLSFNELLKQQLQEIVYEIEPGDKQRRKEIFSIYIAPQFWLFLLPALCGFILHAPLFYLCKLATMAKFRNSDHYDSVNTTLLVFFYPLYLLLIIYMLFPFIGYYALLTLILSPLSAWAAVQAKYMADL